MELSEESSLKVTEGKCSTLAKHESVNLGLLSIHGQGAETLPH